MQTYAGNFLEVTPTQYPAEIDFFYMPKFLREISIQDQTTV